ncbi:UNVERIFIED_CONTAM: ER degradation-enhancing alpha-mannosidase-like protein 1 [Siphonaria sp. JEL0065]|nr:ER degradation-enhancing alpha-mannosidase-like protein 1 [Siphonaria sp. JEL0065]
MILRLLLPLSLSLSLTPLAAAMSTERRLAYVDRAREMFRHGWDGYLNNAFPMDELNPITCEGRSTDRSNPNNWNINDVLGNFSVTLVDSLDAVYTVLGPEEFHRAVNLVKESVSFDQDSRVQVFEVSIRMLGGLVSAHHLASTDWQHLVGTSEYVNRQDQIKYAKMRGYKGELLDLAVDLGERLLPAFETRTGLPFPRVNLRSGVLSWEVKDTCTAGAGTLLMEFGSLARLFDNTGYQVFEKKAKKAFEYLWSRRSHLDLLGNTIDIESGVWLQKLSGIGAGADSFYEYMLKSYILLGDPEYYTMFEQAYDAIMTYNRDEHGFFYKNVDMDNGNILTNWVDSLSAFFPGLQVLAGDLENAIKSHFVYFSIWQRFRAFPERFDFSSKMANIGHYPLRPELVESTYFLYLATKNPFYLEVGAVILEDLDRQTRTSCGFGSMQAVGTSNLDPRMESFFLSETLKYLYLLFDEENIFNRYQTNFIYTTEGHVLPIHPTARSRNKLHPHSSSKIPPRKSKPAKPQQQHPLSQCAKHTLPPLTFPTFTKSYLPLPLTQVQTINKLIGLPPNTSVDLLRPPTTCRQNHTSDTALSGQQPMSQFLESMLVMENDVMVQAPPETNDATLAPALSIYDEGYRLTTLNNVKLTLRLDSTAASYSITKMTLPGNLIYPFNHPFTSLKVALDGVGFLVKDVPTQQASTKKQHSGKGKSLKSKIPTEVLRVMTKGIEALGNVWIEYGVVSGKFSRPLGHNEVIETRLIPVFLAGTDSLLWNGCAEYQGVVKDAVAGKMVVVIRGGCTFEEKALFAEKAGVQAIGIVNHEEGFLGMIGAGEGQSVGVPVIMIGKHDWEKIKVEVNGPSGAEGGVLIKLMEVQVELGDTVEEEDVAVQLQYGNRPIGNLIIVRPKK